MNSIGDWGRFDRLACEQLKSVYDCIKSGEGVSDELSKEIVLLFEDPIEYERLLRLKSGCSTYSDEDGIVRNIRTKEIWEY